METKEQIRKRRELLIQAAFKTPEGRAYLAGCGPKPDGLDEYVERHLDEMKAEEEAAKGSVTASEGTQ